MRPPPCAPVLRCHGRRQQSASVSALLWRAPRSYPRSTRRAELVLCPQERVPAAACPWSPCSLPVLQWTGLTRTAHLHGSLGTAVRGVKAFSYSTSGASVLLMPHIFLNTGLGAQSWALQAVFCGVIGFFTFLTPVMLHLITKGYVVRLYHDPTQDVYTAITYSVFLTEKRTVFHQMQVRLPDVSKMFTTFYADRTGLLVNPDLFTVPQHYNHLMGYDKPFNFCPEQLDKS
uniref:Transmembrane protein 70 n=1 Tax=Neogobius melanostomus TaxID=47308 RepID=A0A8C6T2I1_9GOBI